MNKFTAWAEQHPKLVMLAASVVLFQTIYAWHDVIAWGEGQLQITASESLGG